MKTESPRIRVPKLHIDGLCKRYGPTTALEPTQLSISQGEFLTLLGPSGSGKTTLLQMISGLVEPSEGRLWIDGSDQTHTPAHRRDLGLVFQHYALFPHMTVEENIRFPLKMRGMKSAQAASASRQALELVQLGHLADRYPKELSGGQQQRVALARCFVYKPEVILMDEPLGALDKKLREHMQIEIKRLHRETGATIVYVTHDQEEALAMSDRICLMNHARIEQLGTPHDIYVRPSSAFAADFVGISNAFRGQVIQSSDGTRTISTPLGLFTVRAGRQDIKEGVLVIRPEQMVLNGAGENILCGDVMETVYAGSETRVVVRVAGDTQIIVRLSTDQTPPTIGEAVSVGWKSEAGVLLQ